MTRVGLLFPGEMGTQIGAAAGAEVLWASEGRSDATARRATGTGFRDLGSFAALVEASEVVLSICPPAIAEEVAGQVAELGFSGLYVDANAISPARAQRIAAVLGQGGARVVDGAIIGRTGLNLYLSGAAEDVAQATELFSGSEATAIPLEGSVGAASALKMAFGGWNKAGIALAAQAYAIARAYGVEEGLAVEGVDTERIERAAPKAWRWSPEMQEVAETCAALGLPEEMARGAAELFSRWAAHRDRPAELDRLLDDLTADPQVVDQKVVTLKVQQVNALQEALDQLRFEVGELRASRKRLVLSADADRRSIERELHDGPQQHLVALAVNLQLARRLVDSDPAAAGAFIDALRRDVQEALDEARKLADRIYPPLLEAGGLGVALRSAAATLRVPTRVEVPAGAAYPPEIAGTVYFCCVEALEHVGAGARSTTITVREDEGALVFEIIEDGSGSDVATAGADLASAQERVEALGGRLTIASEPGHGIRVSGSLPMSQ